MFVNKFSFDEHINNNIDKTYVDVGLCQYNLFYYVPAYQSFVKGSP